MVSCISLRSTSGRPRLFRTRRAWSVEKSRGLRPELSDRARSTVPRVFSAPTKYWIRGIEEEESDAIDFRTDFRLTDLEALNLKALCLGVKSLDAGIREASGNPAKTSTSGARLRVMVEQAQSASP